MFNQPPREKEWVSWLTVAAWSLVIFVTIPFARGIQESVTVRWGREVFMLTVVVSLLAAAAFAAAVLLRSRDRGVWVRMAWLVAVTAMTILAAGRMTVTPEESVHFLEYGFLGILLFRALSHRLRDAGIYAVAVLAGSLVGVADEFIQWLVPARFFGFSDVWLNAFAVLLSQVALSRGIRPPFIERRVTPRSVRAASSLAGGLILALALCAANTPAIFEWYTRVPGLAFLRKTAGVMTEYGHRIEDPRIGVFFSRMTPEELRRQDDERGAAAAAVLDKYARPAEYGTFLRRYPSNRDAFLHEARVHLFRRDHYMSVAWKYENNPGKYRFHNTVAFRENQIMTGYFSNTLHHSTYRWSADRIESLEGKIDPSLCYESEVSADLLTGFTERQMWTASLLGLVVLAAVRRYYGGRT